MSSIDGLITGSLEAAAADPAWLGSDEQLEFLAESLPGFGVEDAALAWAPDGQPANWVASTRTIEIERVASGAIPRSDEVIAIYTARGVLHECLHVRYSTPSSLVTRLPAIESRWRPLTAMLFNVLEDARVAQAVGADDPDLAGANTDHLNAAVDQLDERSGTSGSGAEPTYPHSQLAFAVMAYTLAPDRDVVLHPDVVAALDGLRPIINRARDGSRTEVCVGAAVELVDGDHAVSVGVDDDETLTLAVGGGRGSRSCGESGVDLRGRVQGSASASAQGHRSIAASASCHVVAACSDAVASRFSYLA